MAKDSYEKKKKELAGKRITLKSGEQWPAGKKMREKKEKPLKSWGDETPRMK